MILIGFSTAAVLVIVWIGWLRTRRLGYLVLAAWTLTVMMGSAMQTSFFFPAVQYLFGNTLSQESRVELLMWAQLIRLLISTALLIGGLLMLVFRDDPQIGKKQQD